MFTVTFGIWAIFCYRLAQKESCRAPPVSVPFQCLLVSTAMQRQRERIRGDERTISSSVQVSISRVRMLSDIATARSRSPIQHTVHTNAQ
jgi:hypothetical protein